MPNQVDAPILRRDAIFWSGEWRSLPKMKHGAVFLMVSNIAVQAKVCEYRVHLSNMMPREVGEASLGGIEEHGRQLGVRAEAGYDLDVGKSVPTLVNRGEEGVEYFNNVVGSRWIGKVDLSNPSPEVAVVDLVSGVPILGQIDMVIPLKEALGIIELKTTGSRFMEIRDHEMMQASIYCVMMRRLGFKCSRAFVVKVMRGASFVLRNEVEELRGKLLDMPPGQATRVGSALIRDVKVDESGVMRDIENALGYWLYKRNPTHNNSISNCKHCDYRFTCPFSTARGRNRL